MSTYQLEARALYCDVSTPWTAIPGSEFGLWEDRRQHLESAADALPPENVVRVARADGGPLGEGGTAAPLVIAATRLNPKEGGVVVAEEVAHWWVRPTTPRPLVMRALESFPRVAVAALCDAVAVTRPWRTPCQFVELGVRRLREWAVSPTAENLAAVLSALHGVGTALRHRDTRVQADRARALLLAGAVASPLAREYLDRRGAEGLMSEERRMVFGAEVRACLTSAVEATWPGRGTPDAPWLALDQRVAARPDRPTEYQWAGEDRLPPRLMKGPRSNQVFVEAQLAKMMRDAVSVEVAAVSYAASARRRDPTGKMYTGRPLLTLHGESGRLRFRLRRRAIPA